MKKLILLVLLQLLICSMVFGQTDDPGCSKLVTGYDDVCSDGCNTTTGCSTFSFHVYCGGTYYLKAWTACSATNCAHCASCVSIYTDPPGLTPIASVNNLGNCEDLDCDEIVATTALSAGNYIMYVCLVACTDNDEDVCCDPDYGCKAHGCLKWGGPPGCL